MCTANDVDRRRAVFSSLIYLSLPSGLKKSQITKCNDMKFQKSIYQ